MRPPATPARIRRQGAPDKDGHLACLPRTGSKRLKLSALVVQPQLRRCPTPFPSPKRHPATIPPADLVSKSHQNHRSTPIRQIDVMRPRTPNLQSAPSPCALAAAKFAMYGRSGRSFQHSLKHVPPRTNGQTIMIARNASSFSQGSSGRDKPNQV